MSTPLPRLPHRATNGHKGTFGTVAIVGGCASTDRRMIGAPSLAALGALRAGVGLAKLVVPGPIINTAIAIAPSATGIVLPTDASGEPLAAEAPQVFDEVVASCNALVIGPGLGDSTGAEHLTLRAVQQDSVATVIDADALTCLARIRDLFRDFRARAVLTPHPGEFQRLAAALKITASPTDPAQRPAAAAALAQRLGCIVVLKGSGTVVSSGLETWVCEHGHPCMGTAGTGDVLSGIIASLAAQFSRVGDSPLSLYNVARIAVLAHALAGERWAQRAGASAGMLASELADQLPPVLESLR